MPRFIKKPVVVEAVQFTGHNVKEIEEFVGLGTYWYPERMIIEIPTLEGVMTARSGDWIIRGVRGEYYPCKPDIFEATYEPA